MPRASHPSPIQLVESNLWTTHNSCTWYNQVHRHRFVQRIVVDRYSCMLQLNWHYSHLATSVDSLLSSAFSTRVPHNDMFVATFFGDSGDAAAMMRTAGRRVAANGVDYAFEEFTEYYGKDAQRIWNASQLIHPDCDETSGGEHPAESSQPEDCPTSDATGSASEQPPAAAEPSGQELALAPAVHKCYSSQRKSRICVKRRPSVHSGTWACINLHDRLCKRSRTKAPTAT